MLKRLWLRVWTPVLDQLKQGLTPGQAALAIALGAYVGVMPVLGVNALLCALLAAMLGLNQPLAHLSNWVVLPLQLLLMIPFFEAGAWAFGGPMMTLSLPQLLAQVRADPLGVINEFWWIGWHALAVWAAVGLAAVPLAWLLLRLLFSKAVSKLYRG